MTLSLNGIRAGSVRLVTPELGVWAADVDLDLGELPDLPTGPAALVIDKAALVGTIDPAQSGRFGPRARARVVAGGAGWEKPVSAKSYHNDGDVLSAVVLSTTAAEVGERVIEAVPSRLGKDYTRAAGPASSVLAGRPWYVDAVGVTIVGPRIPKPATPTMQVLEWNAQTKVATIACEEIVSPGTILTDPRFGTARVRHVEQTWGESGARALAWTVPMDAPASTVAGTEIVDAIRAIARDATGPAFRVRAKYRVLSQLADGRFLLQVVDKARTGLPDLKAIPLAPAVPGMTVKVPPGSIAHVAFVDGNRTLPVVVGFESGTPIEIAFGPLAAPVALAAPVTTALAAVAAALAAMGKVLPVLEPAASGFATAMVPVTPLLATKIVKAS